MRRLNRVALVVAGMLALVLSPVDGIVGDSLDCMCVSLNEPDDHHLFSPSGNRAYKCDTPGCHLESRDNLCSSEHEGCGVGFAAAGSEAVPGGGSVSLASVYELAGQDGVVYNADRGALQLIGCNGTVTASVMVPDRYAAVIAAVALMKYA